jgi:[ribosomal protein S18]-alanine N-acetyltransferase
MAGDIDALLIVERQCFNVPHYAFYTFDRRDFQHYLHDPGSLFLVAVLDERLAGYVLGPIETRQVPPAAHIDSIAVLPQSQRQGIGSRLLRSFMEQARHHGCELVTLEVSTANEVGLAFFAKHGFRQVRRLRHYYGKGLHALLLAAPASGS